MNTSILNTVWRQVWKSHSNVKESLSFAQPRETTSYEPDNNSGINGRKNHDNGPPV